MSSLVSVIIPVYNRPNLLREALNSIGAQTYRNFEVIIVDDGSIEQVDKIVKEFETNNEQKVIFLRQNHRGPGAGRNLGLKTAHGELIAFLDSDDLWYPEMLESTVTYLQKHGNVDMVCGGWDMIDESSRAKTGVFMPSGLQTKVDTDFTRALILKSLFPIHSVLTRKECFDRCGGFNAELSAFEDWDLWIRMAAKGCRLVFIDMPVARWRVHRDVRRSPSGEAFSVAVAQFFDNLFLQNYIAERYANLRYTSEILMWLQQANYYYQMGFASEVQSCINQAARLLPLAHFDEEIFYALDMASVRFPEAMKFRESVQKLMPLSLRRKFDAEHRWQNVRGHFFLHSFKSNILELIILFFFHPIWVAKKVIVKLYNCLISE